jgi:hypothetical protein
MDETESTTIPMAVWTIYFNPCSKYPGDPYAVATREALLAYANTIEPYDTAVAQTVRAVVKEEEVREKLLSTRKVVEVPKEVPKEKTYEPMEFCARCGAPMFPVETICPHCNTTKGKKEEL